MHKTPLFDEYTGHGAKVVDFHGWMLPVQFSGILEEHQHTRTKAGLFDCSHMAEFILSGKEALRAFDFLVYSDMMSLKPGRCRYSAILNERAGVIDDCVGLRLDEETLYLVTNAGPMETVAAQLAAHGVAAQNISADTAKLDLQGPKSRDILLEMGMEAVGPMAYWTGRRAPWRGQEILVTRAGYTGELGYELYMPNEMAADLWRALVAHPDVQPCGLGARDTLRLEVGYPLYGEDSDETKTPLECGMERFIAWDKEFAGKAALLEQRERGDYGRLTAIRSMDRRAPRHGFELKRNGETVGVVTSGTFGPSVGAGVGLARMSAECAAPGIALTAGPRDMPVETAEIPIYKHGTCRIKI